jgi:demethylmenaquinone methyltransferase/2-methoxy-6-polyprenyl-1,4-benzoquinol methylase
LAEAFRTPDAKRRYTRRLFATIADRYDVITRVLSFGGDQAWKERLMSRANIQPGVHVLDLACGTGDLALLAAARGAAVVGLDFTPRMIELAREKSGARKVLWIVGDMGRLPVVAGRFECVTTGYGLRNVPDLEHALAEIFRVLIAGGRLYSLDFNRPESAVVRAIYLTYLTCVGSLLGIVLHGDPDSYRYIPASIRRYPGARGVAALMREAGFTDVEIVPVLGGFMTIHVATKPA